MCSANPDRERALMMAVRVAGLSSNPILLSHRGRQGNIQILEGSIHRRGTRLSRCATCCMYSQAQSNNDHPFPCRLRALVRLPVQRGRLPVLASHHDCTGTYSREKCRTSLRRVFPQFQRWRGLKDLRILLDTLKFLFLYMRTELVQSISTPVPYSSIVLR